MLLTILKWLVIVIAVVVMAVSLYIYAPGGAGRMESAFKLPAFEPVDFATLRKTPKPNQYLVCPEAFCAETPDRASPIFPVPVDTLAASFDAMVRGQPDTSERQRDAALKQVDYVQRTPRMRYPDLITVRFQAVDETSSTLAIYSRSVYGRSDMGVNKARIDAWLSALEKEVTP
jgi:hypothetical protein